MPERPKFWGRGRVPLRRDGGRLKTYISTKPRARLSREGRKECKLDHRLSLCVVEFEP
uniref:Rat apolipoprotein E protein n=1 Tax=Rattus norvegicus TaxID=10116 RepID=Q65ZS8_RAT|nr:ORF1 [Rattus norvegicus]